MQIFFLFVYLEKCGSYSNGMYIVAYGVIAVLILLLLRGGRKGLQFLWQIVKGYGVPNVTSSDRITKTLIEQLNLGEDDVFIDLGAGEGHVINAVSDAFRNTPCIGYENAPVTFRLAQINLTGTSGKPKILQKNFFHEDLSKATNIYCYLMPHLMEKVRKKISSECQSGTYLYSNAFPIPDTEPQRIITLPSKGKFKTCLYVYQVI